MAWNSRMEPGRTIDATRRPARHIPLDDPQPHPRNGLQRALGTAAVGQAEEPGHRGDIRFRGPGLTGGPQHVLPQQFILRLSPHHLSPQAPRGEQGTVPVAPCVVADLEQGLCHDLAHAPGVGPHPLPPHEERGGNAPLAQEVQHLHVAAGGHGIQLAKIKSQGRSLFPLRQRSPADDPLVLPGGKLHDRLPTLRRRGHIGQGPALVLRIRCPGILLRCQAIRGSLKCQHKAYGKNYYLYSVHFPASRARRGHTPPFPYYGGKGYWCLPFWR